MGGAEGVTGGRAVGPVCRRGGGAIVALGRMGGRAGPHLLVGLLEVDEHEVAVHLGDERVGQLGEVLVVQVEDGLHELALPTHHEDIAQCRQVLLLELLLLVFLQLTRSLEPEPPILGAKLIELGLEICAAVGAHAFPLRNAPAQRGGPSLAAAASRLAIQAMTV